MQNSSGKLVFGVGINDAPYPVHFYEDGIGRYASGKKRRVRVWTCPFYSRWNHMLRRCYSLPYLSKNKTYKGCTVCDEWKSFMNFRSWMIEQDWEDKHLDKDLLVQGNKLYSPETCMFVDPTVNKFILDSAANRGDFLIGVSWHKKDKRFYSRCRNPFTNTTELLGRFYTEIEAHLEWKKRKHELACKLAHSSLVNDPRLIHALETKYK